MLRATCLWAASGPPSASPTASAPTTPIPEGWTQHDVNARNVVRRYLGDLVTALPAVYPEPVVTKLADILGVEDGYPELSQKPDAPFVGAGGSRSGFLGDKDVSTLSALVKGDAIDRTLDVLFTEAERVARFGFTPGELERVKKLLEDRDK